MDDAADAADDGTPSDALSTTERAELAELRTRVAAMEARAALAAKGRKHRTRSFFAGVLITVAALLAPLGAVAVWASGIVGDTDRYVATVAPLASDPDVQAGVTKQVTDAVMERVDVKLLLQQVAPADRPRLEAALGRLEGPLTSGLRGLVESVTARFVTSDAFGTLWTELNRRVHQTVDEALTGSGDGAVKLKGDKVTVDLAPVVEQVKHRLVDSGLTVASRIPEVHTDFTVMTSDQIGKAKTGFRLLQLMGAWLPVIAVLLAAGGVLLAVRRRRALITAALAVAVAVGILGIGLSVFRAFYLDAVPASISPAAAGSVYDALTGFLRTTVRTTVTLGALVALGAWLSGPGRWAVKARGMWRAGIGAVRGAAGVPTGPVGPWVHDHKTWLNWAVLLLTALAFALWDHPTGMVTFWLALGLLALLAVIEFLDSLEADASARAKTPQPS
ncbi:hypothetical protein [Streptomyces sp. MZ04]|uniref:hypothetical protein n=1 Tax=Streptomyces sp. MZ04 TaxID=2559236 RepID=UPI00107EDC9C|nr:hypothetical protein [Streptomyces sp. MZ04]TGB07530.1 hypothetical protein E2651_21550 [Streptomyces sp. MZ04]